MLKKGPRSSITILSVFGYITIDRYVLVPSTIHDKKVLESKFGRKSIVPLDDYLGISRLPFKITINMALNIAKKAITLKSYSDVEKYFLEEHNIEICDDTIKELTDYIGAIVYQNDWENACRCNEVLLPDYHDTEYDLYIQMDGSMILTRDNPKGVIWRETKLGLVFKSSDLIPYYTVDEVGNKILNYRIGKREYIGGPDKVNEFKMFLFWIAKKNGLDKARKLIIICDGAAWIRKFKEEYFPQALLILDIWHLKDNVAKYANLVFPGDKLYRERNIWIKMVYNLFDEGKWKEVLELPETLQYKDQKTPDGTVNLYNYITTYKDCLDYPTYINAGYFIGNGAIEGGNRHVFQQRLKNPGQKWSINSAQSISSLRCKYCSGLWEDEVIPLILEKYRKPEFL